MLGNNRIKIVLLFVVTIKISSVYTLKAQNTTDSISQYGITWIFDKEYSYGQFVNGDYWVVGPVNIINITPKSVISGGRTINGSMLNPAIGYQGFDNWMLGSENHAWNANLNAGRPNGADISVSNPLNISSGSLVTGISYPVLRENKNIRVMAVLTVLTAMPPAGSFRPPYIGKDKSINYNISDVNFNVLPNLSLPPQNPSYTLETQTILSLVEKPWVELMGCWVNEQFCAPENMPCYGRDIANVIGNVACQIMLNIDQSQKQLLVTRLIQIGIDNYGILKNDPYGPRAWEADGGHSCGRAFPILFAGYMLGDSVMFSVMQKSGVYAYQNGYYAGKHPADYIHFGEQDQAFYVTQQAVDITHGVGEFPWQPDTRSTAVAYQTADIGKPAWGIRHVYSPGEDNNHPQAIYLEVNLPSWAGQILVSRILGIKDAWNNPALFDLQDYFLNTPPTAGYFFDDFVHAMWDKYRNLYDNTPQLNENADFFLDQNFPNPCKQTTTIFYQVKKTGFISLKVYDTMGKEIAVLINENKNIGKHHAVFNASHIPAGTYLYILKAGNNLSVRKCVVIK